MYVCCHCFSGHRQTKTKNRPSFRQILMHLNIAAGAFLAIPPETYLKTQVLAHRAALSLASYPDPMHLSSLRSPLSSLVPRPHAPLFPSQPSL